MRVRNAHTSAIDSHEPGATFDVDPAHPGFAPLLRSGQLVPATASDVRFGANDPPPSAAAVRELVAGVNARNRTIEELHAAVDALTRAKAVAGDDARVLQARVNELEALLALRQGAPVEEGAIAAAVRDAESALTARFDAAYASLRGQHDALVTENAHLRADLDGLLAAPAKAAADASDASAPAEKPARTPRQG